ncbi:nodulation protein NodH [Cochlodiniinecator piscidefendens]|uniref:nodulation protein NodH n=1 Tax=Cochlodiniinecator piscidefendens TaxID=2715756 RepID=UPI00140D54A0|nr:nodulation protein NodH [Cochlodiniinecator piscidefendens]
MSKPFDTFIVFAEMRTGSNFLETNLNEFPDIQCHGEAFNPHFIGYPKRDDILRVTQKAREKNPDALLTAIATESDGIGGFRYFHDHDARVLEKVLSDQRCGKVVLTRNPVESYVSWKIAQETGQWKLTNVKHHKTAKIRFDAQEFETHLNAQRAFQLRLLNGLQASGQTAFYIAYEDLQDVDVINGLAQFLGSEHMLEHVSKAIKKQNPSSLQDKVVNYAEMEAELSRIDHFDLGRTPNFEPRRGPAVPSFHAVEKLLYLPVKGGIDSEIAKWMAQSDEDLQSSFTQKTLRQWKRKHSGHRSFSVVMHPAARAHSVYCNLILNTGEGGFTDIRETLRKEFKIPLPKSVSPEEYDKVRHRTCFLAFLAFLKKNLAGQTSVRIDPAWASQAVIVQGFAQFSTPDMVLRAENIRDELAYLCTITRCDLPLFEDRSADQPFMLADIYDAEVEAAAKAAYQKDYMMFGYQAWA